MARSFSILFALSVLGAAQAGAQSAGLEVGDLRFMSGCWRGASSGNTVIEETYTTPSANIMLGTTRYLRGDTTTMFEFSLISLDSTGVVLLPYPRGRPSADGFRLTRAESGVAVFEAPEHDFPKRIVYRRVSADELVARIDGGEGSSRAVEWRLSRVDCPGA